MSETTDALLRQVLERLDHLEARLEKVQKSTDDVAALQGKAPAVIELVASSAEFAWAQAEAAGIDPIQSGQIAAGIALQAGTTENLAVVERALAKTALLSKTLDAVEKLEADGTLDALMEHGTVLAPSLAGMLKRPGLRKLITEASADDKAIDTAQAATTALIETRTQGFPTLGLFGQIKMLMDNDVQKAIGFSLAVAKRFGQLL